MPCREGQGPSKQDAPDKSNAKKTAASARKKGYTSILDRYTKDDRLNPYSGVGSSPAIAMSISKEPNP